MIKVIGQATQNNGSSPTWQLTGICKSAARTGTGTYTITCSKECYTVLISAERGDVGTERIVATWSNNILTIRNYTGLTSTALGDCWLTVTFIENLPDEQTTLLKYGSDENRLTYKAPPPPTYTRFMWRWDGLVSGDVFQMGAIKLNGINLPYTYVTFGKSSGSDIASQMAEKMVATITGNDPNHKWCIGGMSNTKWGWFIFDMPTAIIPSKYELQIAGDTTQYPGRNPTRTRLYASTGTPTTFDDSSWKLIVDSSMSLPTTNYGWVTVWEK